MTADISILLEFRSLHDPVIDHTHLQVIQTQILSGLEQLKLITELLRYHHIWLRAG